MAPGGLESLAPFILLACAILGLWAPRHTWAAILALAVIVGYATGVVTGAAAVWLAFLALSCHAYMNASMYSSGAVASATMRAVSLLAIVVLSLALGLHAIPAFHNRELGADIVLGPHDAPYAIWLNFDKAAAGLLLLGLCFDNFIRCYDDLSEAIRKAWLALVATVVALSVMSLWLGYVVWEPKWRDVFWLWAPVNLLGTCMSEEALFRAFLQRQLTSALSGRNFGSFLAIGLSAILFGLAHLAGGWRYVALAAIAGVGYGYIFHRTQRVEMSMLAHFSVNVCQFLFFSYPFYV